MLMHLQTPDQASSSNEEQRRRCERPPAREAVRTRQPKVSLHAVLSTAKSGEGRRRTTAMANASPAPRIAIIPANSSRSLWARDAPPNPVCGAPVGTMPVAPRFELAPAAPPAPEAE